MKLTKFSYDKLYRIIWEHNNSSWTTARVSRPAKKEMVGNGIYLNKKITPELRKDLRNAFGPKVGFMVAESQYAPEQKNPMVLVYFDSELSRIDNARRLAEKVRLQKEVGENQLELFAAN